MRRLMVILLVLVLGLVACSNHSVSEDGIEEAEPTAPL